ncbi:hypothetical protein J2Z22_003034 [Paenibacillus forsythiae]|uniref:Uncharacterized protein n=1 Tax=Paenibacillus forsythiae TaxID=365616 RepID=A0ABU3HAJ4_9BACL|nr:hypothetical protein [Paenibacillus forsythiae]
MMPILGLYFMRDGQHPPQGSGNPLYFIRRVSGFDRKLKE